VIIRVKVVLKRTVIGDWRFDNLSGSHLQTQANGVFQAMMLYVCRSLKLIGQFTLLATMVLAETISRILQPYNIRVAKKPTTTLRPLADKR